MSDSTRLIPKGIGQNSPTVEAQAQAISDAVTRDAQRGQTNAVPEVVQPGPVVREVRDPKIYGKDRPAVRLR